MDVQSRRRVKLYVLNEERMWSDQGTGHVSSVFLDKFNGMSLIVRSEDDGSMLLESKIQSHTAYQKQQDTLIVWSELDNDYAISFQEKAGCDEIWQKICQVQGKDPSVDLTQECIMHEESVIDDMGVDDDRFHESLDTSPPMELPPCELSKLDEIAELFSSMLGPVAQQEKLAAAIENEGYIKKLLNLFHMCEDLEDLDGLHHLYDIFKSMFSLNKSELFEVMFQEDTIFDVIGVFEYDHKSPTHVKHRDFLKKQAQFKEVVPVNNPELIQKIHQTYRIQYIQDVLLPAPSVFEENMLSTLNSLIYFNKSEIVSILQEDDTFLQCLFQQITDDEIDDDKRTDLVRFLKEFCHFSQTLQPESKAIFLKNLMNFGVLAAIETVLGLDGDEMKTAAIDVFSYVLEHSPSSVRSYIVQESKNQDDDDLLVNLVIEQLISDNDPELAGAVRLLATMRTLLDPESMALSENKTEKTEFLGFFYKHSMHVLTAPLFANTVGENPNKDDYRTAQLLSLILELLTFCIEHHSYHMQNYIINKDMIRRVLILLKSKHKFLALSALRLVRRTIGLKEEIYYKYIIKGDLFKPIAEAFTANGAKYNLLNSAMIDLFEFIKTESIECLVRYITECHFKTFENVTYVETFKNLKRRYEQYKHTASEKSSIDNMPILHPGKRLRRDARAMEEEEEIWFEGDDDFEESDNMLPISEVLKPKSDFVFDHINRFLERKSIVSHFKDRDVKENDCKDSPQRLFNRTGNPINININNSPTNRSSSPPSNPPTPTTTPVNSPVSPALRNNPLGDKSNALAASTPKPGLVGLVDYPDDDEDDEETDDNDTPASKRQRITT